MIMFNVKRYNSQCYTNILFTVLIIIVIISNCYSILFHCIFFIVDRIVSSKTTTPTPTIIITIVHQKRYLIYLKFMYLNTVIYLLILYRNQIVLKCWSCCLFTIYTYLSSYIYAFVFNVIFLMLLWCKYLPATMRLAQNCHKILCRLFYTFLLLHYSIIGQNDGRIELFLFVFFQLKR